MGKRIHMRTKDIVPGTAYIDDKGKEWLYIGCLFMKSYFRSKTELPPVPEELKNVRGVYHYVQMNGHIEELAERCKDISELLDIIAMDIERELTYVDFQIEIAPMLRIMTWRYTPKMFIQKSRKVLDNAPIYDHILFIGDSQITSFVRRKYYRIGDIEHVNMQKPADGADTNQE